MIIHKDQEEGKNICCPNLYLIFYWKSNLVKIKGGGRCWEEEEKENDWKRKGKIVDLFAENDLYISVESTKKVPQVKIKFSMVPKGNVNIQLILILANNNGQIKFIK